MTIRNNFVDSDATAIVHAQHHNDLATASNATTGPTPTGVAATDTAAVQAALTAGVGGVTYLTIPGTFAINATLHLSGSLVLGASTVLQASATIAGPLLDTPVGTLQYFQSIIGGTFDANANAQNALYVRYAENLLIDQCHFMNATQDDVVIGDPAAAAPTLGVTVGCGVGITRTQTFNAGYSCLWLRHSADARVLATGYLYGQETGIRIEGDGDHKFFGVHPFGAGAGLPMLQCFYDASGWLNEYHGCASDCTGNVAHSGASTSGVAGTVTDAAIKAQHLGLRVTGSNIPAGCYVGSVTAGASFTLVDQYNAGVNTTGTVSGITLGGTGWNLVNANGPGSSISGSSAFLLAASQIVDNTQVAITLGPGEEVTVTGFQVRGNDASHRFAASFVGDMRKFTWSGLSQVNVVDPVGSSSTPTPLWLTLGPGAGCITLARTGNADSSQYTATPATGVEHLSYFYAQQTVTVQHVQFQTAGTAGSGLTYSAVGLYSINASGDATRVATMSSTAFTSTWSLYNLALTAPFTLIAGKLYAVGLLQVGTTPVSILGQQSTYDNSTAVVMSRSVSGQATLASSFAAGVLNPYGFSMYYELLP